MYNWSTDTARLKKSSDHYERFVLQQRINFGSNHQKLSLELLRKHWDTLEIDPSKRKYLQKIVWPKQS